MDRQTQEQRTLTGVTGTFTKSYVYNFKGDLTQMTYPSGRVVQYNYATGGGCCNSRLASVVDQTTNTTVTSGLAYNAAGETISRTLGNGVTETFAYNNRLQETGITATLSSVTLMNFTYNYGTSTTNTGRVLSRTDAIQPEHSVNYTYDSIYRLSQAAAPDSSWGISWSFDVWGNRLTQTPQGLATGKVGTQTFGYTNNRLTSSTYDTAGNQTNDGLHNYIFNAENQITQMDGGSAAYGYDGEGRRMKKIVGLETTYYFYGVGGLLCEFTTTNTGATQASSTNRTTYRTSDKLGTAVLLIAASGAVVENNRTLPYGEAWLPEVSSTNDKKFTTYQRDQESGLDYAMARYDGSTIGRLLSPDRSAVPTTLSVLLEDATGRDYAVLLNYLGTLHPELRSSVRLREPLTLNAYLYAKDDPINFIDPTGLEPGSEGENNDICDTLLKAIDRFLYEDDQGFKGIIQRFDEQIHGQFTPDTRQWETHNQQIKANQNGLRKTLDNFRKNNCGDPPPTALEWVDKPLPDADDYEGPNLGQYRQRLVQQRLKGWQTPSAVQALRIMVYTMATAAAMELVKVSFFFLIP